MKKLLLLVAGAVAGVAILYGTNVSADGRSRMDMFDELQQQLNLRFFDALTGKPIPGATVTFQGETSSTDADGMASFTFPEVPVEREVDLIARFEKNGYVTSDAKVHFMLGTVWFNRFSISPALPLGKLRIVLDWDSAPLDLDAHLIKAGGYHISYRNMRQFEDQVLLDRDDTDGYGPETITINRVDNASRYAFYVHDYSDRDNAASDGLVKSKAHVRVYSSERLVDQFIVPRSGNGMTWKVFEIVGGAVRAAGELSPTAP